MELKQLHEEMNKVWVEMKDMITKQETEIKKYGDSSQETVNTIKALNDKITEIEVKMNRPNMTAGETKGNKSEEDVMKVKAFDSFLRKGIDKMSPEEMKLLTASNDTTGGYLAGEEMLAEIIANLVEYSPIRSIARVRTTSQRTVKIKKKTGNTTATWTNEGGTKASGVNAYAFGMEELPVHEMSAYVDVSVQDLEDAQYDLEGDLNADMSEQFGVAEGTAFVTGNAVGKPEGILTNPTVAGINSGIADDFDGDSLMSMFYGTKSLYANNGTWAMNRLSLKKVRTLKDGNGNYLWNPNIGLGQPATILERPYIECLDMPAVAAGTYPVAFGDFKRGYLIVDRIQIEMLRDPYTQANVGAVRFYARKRVGAQVILPEAIKKMFIGV